jgi:putative hydrolase of the HAD superfamily
VLDYLSAHYSMTIVTNGFEEIQSVKLLSGNITHYFNHVITSQKAGFKKPSREIFDYALSVNNLANDEVIMIGDNLITDIGGAKNAQIDTVFYNPAAVAHTSKVNYEIRCLSELQNIL